MSTVDALLGEIFEGKHTAFAAEFGEWVRGSRRFKAFATEHRNKLRAKLKNARDEASVLDVRAEVETAALLLREPRFEVEYETYTAQKRRGPDFTVTFKTHTPFNVEVRRVRVVELFDDALDLDAVASKLMWVLCAKVGQMPPSIVNLLWLTSERAITEGDLNSAMIRLQRAAELKVEDYFTRRGFASAADFLKQYRQLSGVVLHQAGGNRVCLNTLARHPTPPEIVTAIQRLGA